MPEMPEPLIVIPGMESSYGTLMDAKGPGVYYLASSAGGIKTGVNIEPQKALQASVVGSCINRIADQIAALTWTAEDPRVQRLLDETNDLQTTYDLFYAMTWDLLLYGKAYMRHAGGMRRSAQLGTLDYNEVMPGVENGKAIYKVTPSDGRSSDLLLAPGGIVDNKQIIPFTDMSHSRGYNNRKINLAGEAIIAIIEYGKKDRERVKRGPNIGTVLSTQQPTTLEWKEENREAIQKMYGENGYNQDGLFILDRGASVTPYSSAGTADPEIRKRIEAHEAIVCGIFGVPPFMVGVISESDSKYANQKGQAAVFLRGLLEPLSRKIGMALTKHFKSKVKADLMGLLAGDLAEAAKIVKDMAGVWDRATALKLTGQPYTEEDIGKMYTSSPGRSDDSGDPNQPRAGDEPNE